MLEVLLTFAFSEYGIFTSGFLLATLLIEFRMNIRRLYQNEDVNYRPILPVFIIPNWAISYNGSFKKLIQARGFGNITLLNLYAKRTNGGT